MKSTGIVRRVDELGRIVIPKELRKVFDITEGDALEVFTDTDGKIVLRKYQPGCSLCGCANIAATFGNSHFCQECIDRISKLKTA